MRTLRWSLAVAIVLVLAGGAVSVGQPPGVLMPAASDSVTVEMVDRELVTPGVMRPDAERAVYHTDGHRIEATWVASDPRLSGGLTIIGSKHINRDGSMIETELYTVVNRDGRWVGESIGFAVAQPMPDLVIGNGLLPVGPDHEDFVVFKGEGSYQGLGALVDIDWSQQPTVIQGTIFRGELPPLAMAGAAG